jgi:hypothetical protein
MRWVGDKKAYPIWEVHFQGKDADIFGTSVSGVIDVDTVGEDAVNGGHFWREREW